MSIIVKQRPTTSTSSAAAHLFSPIPACFRRPRPLPGDPPSTTSTSVYATDLGACVLTWTRTLLGRTLRIQLRNVDYTLKIRSKPFLFWRNRGLKSLNGEAQIWWDFRRCRFGGSETEAESGFYLAVVVGGELVVLIGDLAKPVYSRLRLAEKERKAKKQRLVVRKEHVSGTRFFRASAAVGGRKVRILMEHFYSGRDSGLRLSFNGQCVLEMEHLVWKFRGSEQVEYEGVSVSVSWDVYSWLFSSAVDVKKNKSKDGKEPRGGVFVFDFERVLGSDDEEEEEEEERNKVGSNNVSVWEKTRRSEISSSVSSISSWGSSSSVMGWWSAEEKEMGCAGAGGGFSLVVYATKS